MGRARKAPRCQFCEEPSPPRDLAGTVYDGARAVRPVHLLNDGGTLFRPTTRTHPLGTANPLTLDDVLTEPLAPQQGHVTINEADLIVVNKPFPVHKRTPAVRSTAAPICPAGSAAGATVRWRRLPSALRVGFREGCRRRRPCRPGICRAGDDGAMIRVTFVLSLRWGCSARCVLHDLRLGAASVGEANGLTIRLPVGARIAGRVRGWWFDCFARYDEGRGGCGQSQGQT